mgnify:FL=1
MDINQHRFDEWETQLVVSVSYKKYKRTDGFKAKRVQKKILETFVNQGTNWVVEFNLIVIANMPFFNILKASNVWSNVCTNVFKLRSYKCAQSFIHVVKCNEQFGRVYIGLVDE